MRLRKHEYTHVRSLLGLLAVIGRNNLGLLLLRAEDDKGNPEDGNNVSKKDAELGRDKGKVHKVNKRPDLVVHSHHLGKILGNSGVDLRLRVSLEEADDVEVEQVEER